MLSVVEIAVMVKQFTLVPSMCSVHRRNRPASDEFGRPSYSKQQVFLC